MGAPSKNMRNCLPGSTGPTPCTARVKVMDTRPPTSSGNPFLILAPRRTSTGFPSPHGADSTRALSRVSVSVGRRFSQPSIPKTLSFCTYGDSPKSARKFARTRPHKEIKARTVMDGKGFIPMAFSCGNGGASRAQTKKNLRQEGQWFRVPAQRCSSRADHSPKH